MSVPLLIAHRGDSAHAPENTLRACARAIAKGADWIELDLQLSADDEVVVFHDAELDRLTGQEGQVALWSRSDLTGLAVQPWDHTPRSDSQIPTLSDVLKGPGRQVPLYLELKGEGGGRSAPRSARLLERVLELVPEDAPHALASFDADLVRGVIQAGRRAVHIAADPRRLDDLAPAEQSQLFAFSALHQYADEALAARLRGLEVPLWLWTVDRPEDLARAWTLDPEAICSNDVAAARAWINAKAGG